MAVTERPAWVDDELFPFESRFVDIDGHSVHYVDEGSGPTLLFLHGNPTWSFVYREVIESLRDEFRCIAVDYPGFGLSSAAPGYRYLPAEHAQVRRDPPRPESFRAPTTRAPFRRNKIRGDHARNVKAEIEPQERCRSGQRAHNGETPA